MQKGQEQETRQIDLHEPSTDGNASRSLSRGDEPQSREDTSPRSSKMAAKNRRNSGAETLATEPLSSLSSLEVAPEAASTDNEDSQRTLLEDEDDSLDPRTNRQGSPRNFDCCEKDTCNNEKDNDSFDESVLADLGFLMEGARAGEKQVLEWTVPVPVARRRSSIQRQESGNNHTNGNGNGVAADEPFRVQVVAHNINEEPGAVQSGHYLWPGAQILVDHLVNHYTIDSARLQSPPIESVVELGAGCAVSTLACLQLHQSTLQVAVCTDHDPGVLERARDGYESTMEHLMSKAMNEDELNDLINCLASIPVLFEPLEWGSTKDAQTVSSLVKMHTVNESDKCDLVLGSDLIYSADVIKPLLSTASLLMNKASGRFLLSQSFSYDEEAEAAVVAACQELGLERTILWQDGTGEERVQEFRHRRSA